MAIKHAKRRMAEFDEQSMRSSEFDPDNKKKRNNLVCLTVLLRFFF